MITAKEARKITEESHPHETEIHPVKKAYLETCIKRAAEKGKLSVNFGNLGDWKITAWLSSYGYNCWYDNQLSLWVGWNK